jgi:hypothetical protein
MQTNNEQPYHPASIRIALSEGALDLSFKKADGSVRHMVCTTRAELIAQVTGRDLTPHYEYTQTIDEDTDLVRAFDLQAGGWRSFYAASVFRLEEFQDEQHEESGCR